ncbi:unnamed protein product [Schistosoma mattheei]|uniref:Uncharacterized protein n=1 Tax=Schistosoma mattheei TaxID=31246 RepID=A0A3P8EHW3_9TREM|nr:unnamed protein product [Schistosoma mattheei]
MNSGHFEGKHSYSHHFVYYLLQRLQSHALRYVYQHYYQLDY